MKSNILVLVRHGQSEWNKLNLFTGWKDPDLTQQGIAEATQAGAKLKEMSIKFDLMYTSVSKSTSYRNNNSREIRST